MNGISRLLLGAMVLGAACQSKPERSPEETAALDSASAAARDSAHTANAPGSMEGKSGVPQARQGGTRDRGRVGPLQGDGQAAAAAKVEVHPPH